MVDSINIYNLETNLDQVAALTLAQLEQAAKNNPKLLKILKQGGVVLENLFAKMLQQEYPAQFGQLSISQIEALISSYPSLQAMLQQAQTNYNNAVSQVNALQAQVTQDGVNIDDANSQFNTDLLNSTGLSPQTLSNLRSLDADVEAIYQDNQLPSEQNLSTSIITLISDNDAFKANPTVAAASVVQNDLSNFQTALAAESSDLQANLAVDSNLSTYLSQLQIAIPQSITTLSNFSSVQAVQLQNDVSAINFAADAQNVDLLSLANAQILQAQALTALQNAQIPIAVFSVLTPLQLKLVTELPSLT